MLVMHGSGAGDARGQRMSSGLIALLDDVAALAKSAAVMIDDVAAQAAKAGVKAAGVVIDDAAVTPRYVAGMAPSRELPVVARIAMGSLRNKLLYLLPASLALGLFAPWAVTPLLMLGGAYLCFEGAEKLIEAFRPHAEEVPTTVGEEARIAGAIRTDFILSAEIMALPLSTVADAGLLRQALVLGGVGIFITLGVYGAVALIVKADDLGLAMVRTGRAGVRQIGGALVRGMVPFLQGLSAVGTAAMLWVGGGILLHGLEEMGVPGPAHWVAHVAAGSLAMGGAVAGWLAGAGLSGVVGLGVGMVIVPAEHAVMRLAKGK